MSRELATAKRKRATMMACGYTADSPETAILHSEIRQYLRSLNPAERELILEHPDSDTILAVVLGPSFLSGVSSEKIYQLREMYARAANPVAWQSVNELISISMEQNHG